MDHPGVAAGAKEAEIADLSCACPEHFAPMLRKGDLLARLKKPDKRLTNQLSSRDAQQHAGTQIRFPDHSFPIECDMAGGSKVIQFRVSVTCRLQLELGSPELLILHFQFNLIDVEILDQLPQVPEARGRALAQLRREGSLSP